MSKLIEQFTEWVKTLSKNFYLSLISSDFYSELYIKHKGYGFKYLINICILSSMILCSALIVQVNYQKKNFNSGSHLHNTITELDIDYGGDKSEHANKKEGSKAIISQDTQRPVGSNNIKARNLDLNYIINQFPVLKYDGESMSYYDESMSEDTKDATYIKLPSGQSIAVIDLDGKYLKSNESNYIPVVFTKKLIRISFLSLEDETEAAMPLDYQSIFGDEPRVIDQSSIREVLSQYFDYAPRFITYVFFPIFSLLLFGVAIFQNLATIAILLLISFLFYKNPSWRSCVRLVVFSAASVTMVQSLLFFIMPELLVQKWMLGLWVNFLMVVGLFKVLRSTKGSIARFKR